MLRLLLVFTACQSIAIAGKLNKDGWPLERGLQGCTDENAECSSWASTGECEENPKYMLVNCKKSCNNCLGEDNSICSRLPIKSTNHPAYDHGTALGVFQEIMESSDSSMYMSTSYKGQGIRRIWSRTKGEFYETNAYLYDVTFSDQSHTVEFRVDEELGNSYAEVVHYATALGRVPKFARARIDFYVIAPGNHPQAFGASYDTKTIYTELEGASRPQFQDGLEETLLHEAGHASFDNLQDDADWIRAADSDGNYISTYAQANPYREDLAESFVAWFALRCRSDRLPQNDRQTICSAIPYRLAFFDSVIGIDCNPI